MPFRAEKGVMPFRAEKGVMPTLGAVGFEMAEILRSDSHVTSVIMQHAESGREVGRVNAAGNGYYNFQPKAVLPGTYDVLFHYGSSPAPTPIAIDVVVSPGEESVVTLDAGIVVAEATSTDVTGWDLVPIASPDGATPEPLLQARPPFGNKDSLWRPYIVPPGRYRLRVHIAGMNEALTLPDDIEIEPGQTLEFDPDL